MIYTSPDMLTIEYRNQIVQSTITEMIAVIHFTYGVKVDSIS